MAELITERKLLLFWGFFFTFCVKYVRTYCSYNTEGFCFLCSSFFQEDARILDKVFVLFFGKQQIFII